eukprot:TRINITY_DN1134_c0_g1_i1.p1 TRINITY_DN1134_c0_g1~~TRINITY_DN1134_c0_g1_i1.p1  ORF type:complete len:512 (-),score=123.57 TRINITY_DN1134_c0_g1_i1:26-1561(-)
MTLLLALLFALLSVGLAKTVGFVPFTTQTPTSLKLVARSGNSTLSQAVLPASGAPAPYVEAPYVLKLVGTRKQIGYDYAALLHTQTVYTLDSFIKSVFSSPRDQLLITLFLDYCWDSFLVKHTPQDFLDELAGMRAYHAAHPGEDGGVTTDMVSQRFFTLANMPADPVNIIAMLEEELEMGLPPWLKAVINEIVRLLEHLVHSCDAYGVWGSRTVNGTLYSSRNLDYNKDTGINKYKLVTFFDIDDAAARRQYATIGFAFGPGALAGISLKGMTVSEMNLDNSRVTFSGLAFPLRLRRVLELSSDLHSAMTTWNATHNTNSFNFLIASARDNAAFALETIRDFTAVFPADSPVEAAATVDCSGAAGVANKCHKWANGQTGAHVQLGKPLPEAVWRTNHGMSPVVFRTQEALFNDTVFRYDLMHTLFTELAATKTTIADHQAIGIVATLGTKGPNFFECAAPYKGDNTMSISYAPKVGGGYFHAAWERGSGSEWRPAACAPFIRFDLAEHFE